MDVHGWAHPRSRGENTYAGEDRNLALGASPLTRGKRCSSGARRVIAGRIPAHAGKTQDRRDPRRHRRAHPRSRGENYRKPALIWLSRGASPLTRGKRWWRPPPSMRCGRIPAHAGKTATHEWVSGRWWAHPRSRGENFGPSPKALRLPGASPLTRGKPHKPGGRTKYEGRIPAHAGKTLLSGTVEVSAWGASPLTRGKLNRRGRLQARAGRIPAHAGKTDRPHAGHLLAGAHPRSRGENGAPPARTGPTRGASPLTRGKHNRARQAGVEVGRIPAHAGKTARAWNAPDTSCGASPLTRGKLDSRGRLQARAGRIPAHAGKTHQPGRAAYQAGAHPRSRGENRGQGDVRPD